MKENEGIYMSKKGQLSFETVSEFMQGRLTRKEAAELLQVRERTISRIARRIEVRGIEAVVHANRGKAPWNQKAKLLKESVLGLIRERYFDFNLTHALEKIRYDHGIQIPYETLRRWCHEEHLVKRCKRRKTVARYTRVRMPNEGLLLQLDGSPHRYNGKDEWCLIGAIDDATSDIPYAEFFLSEDTLNCMRVIQKIIENYGIPHAIYVDQAGCWGGGKRAQFSQFKRACEELGIRVIFARSPQAKGRIERAWGTIQDRIIPEMRLRKIQRLPAANEYLQERFLPDYWKRTNTVTPKSSESRYRPYLGRVPLNEILCIKEYRTVKANHTLSWENLNYELKSPLKYSIYKQKIEIRTYQDLTWKAFFAGRPIELIPLDDKVVNLVA